MSDGGVLFRRILIWAMLKDEIVYKKTKDNTYARTKGQTNDDAFLVWDTWCTETVEVAQPEGRRLLAARGMKA